MLLSSGEPAWAGLVRGERWQRMRNTMSRIGGRNRAMFRRALGLAPLFVSGSALPVFATGFVHVPESGRRLVKDVAPPTA